MQQHRTHTYFTIFLLAVFSLIALVLIAPPQTNAAFSNQTQSGNSTDTDARPGELTDGSLQLVKDGKFQAFCPLKHTDVQAEISGFLSRVTVTQEFVNPSSSPVEAIYVFPLPNNAAVDDMTLHVGSRTIVGLIKERGEAQKIYQQARQSGHTAALLDQERPNIFTQSVANIPPGSNVKIEISYVETLKYEAGSYEFVYPMVVGPRYIPGTPTSKQGGGWSPDTDRVPDASRITPPVAGVHRGVKGSRAGHDISVSVKLDAGVTIHQLASPSHKVNVQTDTAHSASVELVDQNEIPNRDFILRYDVAGKEVDDALLVHSRPAKSQETKGGGAEFSANDGFFTFILQPPDRVALEDATPRELIFVLDTSGSMYGFPMETAKKTMTRAINNMRPQDTFNLISFSGDEHILFPQPVVASAANIAQATQFIAGQHGSGGTEMMKAIRAALGDDAGNGTILPVEHKCGGDCDTASDVRAGAKPLRVVVFMTDGYVGNDMEIIGAIQKHPEARVFSFGIGSSVNRFLMDGMARAGRGEVEYVTRQEDAEPAADKLYERIHTPVLTDISIDWGGLPVHDVMPAKVLDLFTAKPLVITGRYSGEAKGVLKLRGLRAGRPFERTIKVNLPGDESSNRSLEQLWARSKIDELMSQDWDGLQQGNPKKEVRDQITQLGLAYKLMTQYTSFVAVEEQTVVDGGAPHTIYVPVEIPQGVTPETAVGGTRDRVNYFSMQSAANAPAKVGVGYGQGVGGGVYQAAPAPPPPTNGPIGAVTETIDVTAESPIVESQSSQLSTTMTASDEMPNAVGPIFKSKDPEERERQKAAKQAKDEKLRADLRSKLNPALLAVYQCWLDSGKTGQGCSGLANGKVAVELWLQGDASTAMQKLQALGFTPHAGFNAAIASSGAVKGTLDIARLAELVKLEQLKLAALAK
jgi:Ca-activated chloride channel family protein